MENKITEFGGQFDEDMNRELYLLEGAEITKAQYDAIKAGYGVTGPDFQIIQKGTKYYLKGDMDIADVKAIVDKLLVEKGEAAVFNTAA